MELDHETCYRALLARDARFDGLFFVGVKTTGIYCRPVCTARTPGSARCRFFAHAAQAERAGFRPCLRCRPELAPGRAPIDAVANVARLAAARIEAGALNDGGSLECLARELGLSSRQLRRAVRREFGVTAVELAQTRRLLLAKQLLAETSLPVTQVAYAAGFESVRRFNALFRTHYRLAPSALRRAADTASHRHSLRLTLAYRPPCAWPAMTRFLAARATPGVEQVVDGAYSRTVSIGAKRGWLRVEPLAGRHALAVVIDAQLTGVLPELLARLRRLFDLDCAARRHCRAASHGPAGRSVRRSCAGLRVPGAFDPFELAVRAILGQVVSVKSATTLAGRLTAAFGEAIETPHPALTRLAPTPERLAAARALNYRALGIPAARAETIRAVARAVAGGQLALRPGAPPEATIEQLLAIDGIGRWTAGYIAMRALAWPDALAEGDLGLLKACGLRNARALERLAEAWRPWRAYAAMHLWERLPISSETDEAKEKCNGHPHRKALSRHRRKPAGAVGA